MLALILISCGKSEVEVGVDAGFNVEASHAQQTQTSALTAERAVLSPHASGVVVYERKYSGSQTLAETGDLTPRIWQQTARPWTYDGPDEEYLYDEDVYGADDGPVPTSTYRIIRRPNPNFGVPKSWPDRPLRMDAAAISLASNPTATDMVQLSIKLRDFPDWDIPPKIPFAHFSPGEVEAVKNEREAAKQSRREAFDAHSTSLRDAIVGFGGRVIARRWQTGWLAVEVPAHRILDLSERSDLVRIHADLWSDRDACDTSCTMESDTKWKLGSGTSSSSPGGRDKDRIDVQSFLDAGYDGLSGAANGRFLAAVIETDRFEDESPAFDSWTGGGSRIQGRFRCASWGCWSVADFDDEPNPSGHPTMVANALLGDFEDNQAAGIAYGDVCWDGISHCADWKKASSGMAPEAAMLAYAAGSGVLWKEEAYLHAATIQDDVDVINASHVNVAEDCDITSSRADEDAAEVAFDEGILFVAAAGNNNDGGSTSCDMDSPGDTPKVFTVNAYQVDNAACAGDFNDCDLSPDKHRMGGLNAPLASGVLQLGAITGIDSMAPSHAFYHLDEDGPAGVMEGDVSSTGTSFAAPHVAGAALLVKDWQLDDGHTWIESPGRLHTMMLSMADRADAVGVHRTKGADDLWGMGRARMRYKNRSQFRMRTTTRSTTGTTSFLLSNDPTPSSTTLIKCVLMEDEDMSGKDTVGDVTLKVSLREPVSGSCSHSGTLIQSRWDNSYDLKHMVRYHDSFTDLDDVCVDIDVDYFQIAGSSITTHTYCYSSVSTDTAP